MTKLRYSHQKVRSRLAIFISATACMGGYNIYNVCLGNADSPSTRDLKNGMVQETRTHSSRSRALHLRFWEHDLILDALHLGSPRKTSLFHSNCST